MRLTEDLAARVPPHTGESGRLAGRSDLPTDAEYAAAVAELLAGAPPSREAWVFAYGSLIWNPGGAAPSDASGAPGSRPGAPVHRHSAGNDATSG